MEHNKMEQTTTKLSVQHSNNSSNNNSEKLSFELTTESFGCLCESCKVDYSHSQQEETNFIPCADCCIWCEEKVDEKISQREPSESIPADTRHTKEELTQAHSNDILMRLEWMLQNLTCAMDKAKVKPHGFSLDYTDIQKEIATICRTGDSTISTIDDLKHAEKLSFEDVDFENEEEEVYNIANALLKTKRKPVRVCSKTKQKAYLDSTRNHNKHHSEYSNTFTAEEKKLYGIVDDEKLSFEKEDNEINTILNPIEEDEHESVYSNPKEDVGYENEEEEVLEIAQLEFKLEVEQNKAYDILVTKNERIRNLESQIRYLQQTNSDQDILLNKYIEHLEYLTTQRKTNKETLTATKNILIARHNQFITVDDTISDEFQKNNNAIDFIESLIPY